ncbi:MAG: peptidylprolyl isomerase, partial [Clostridia bacterium]|nr:peptidylprolyl isomerase [Clostridia bacterium]
KDDGGLMEDVIKGQMVETFNDWIFDPARKVGDVDFVKTEYGWHLVYFSAFSREAYKITVEEAIRQKTYNDEYDAIMANYPVYVDGIQVYEYSR